MTETMKRYHLTHPQQRIWYTEKMHPGTGMWNNAGTLKIKGQIDYALLERALNITIEENDSIRLRIGVEDGVPYQYVAPFAPYRVEVLDFLHAGVEKLYEWDSRQTKAPMPLIDNPLYFFAFLSVSEEECGFYAKFHHIISDAISIVEFSNQVMECYQQLLCGNEPKPIERPGYIDYIAGEQEYFKSKRFTYDHEFWKNQFAKPPEPTIIKQIKKADIRTEAQRKAFVLPEAFSAKIREYCEKTDISVFALFLSALSIYIHRVTGKKNIIIGSPVANRSTIAEKAMFGMFVSTVPVCIEISDALSFAEFSQIVSNQWFSALKHQKYPYDLLMHELHQTYKNLDLLCDVTLSYQYGKFIKNTERFTYEGRWHFSGSQASALNIHVNDREDDGRFILDYDYQTQLFYGKEIEYFHSHMVNIIRDMISHPKKPIYMLNLLSEEERRRILHGFNDTKRNYPAGETLAELLQRSFESVPEATAIVCAGRRMSYRELDERSDALAAHLVCCGVGKESIVGLLTARSMEHCVWVAAILKAGGAFLPIDPELPAERIAYMLSDSGAKILIVTPRYEYKCPKESGLHVIFADAQFAPAEKCKPACTPDSLAYVIYTSGSTGQPKGVQIEHRSIVHFVYSMGELWDLSPGGRLLGASSISFDVSVMEYALALTSGLTFVFAQEHEVAVPRSMAQLIEAEKVNMMVVTPGRMEMLLSDKQGSECIANFREIGMAGDVLSEKLLRRVQQLTRARIMNQYGPTEITILATTADVTNSKAPSIGHPMPDVKAYILDVHQNPVPIGVPGELYIGGPGVARGYISKPDMNRERFIENPFESGERLYRTGDLARWYPLGEIEFLGRIDKQVKIRGYRIELGEIENRLLGVPGVKSCAVTDYTNDASGSRFLCAYLCGNPPKNVDIKAQLSRDLPAYMIPSVFITVEKLPFNNSGKVDRSRLPDPMAHLEAQKEGFQPPETATEQLLAEIWSAELGLARIGRNDSFFDLGGDSLSILHVMTRIEQQFHVAFRHEEVYRSPQLCDMAGMIDSAEQSAYRPILRVPQQRDYPVSSAQQRMWVVTHTGKNSVAYNIPVAFEIIGKLDVERLEQSFQQLVDMHEALRTSFVLSGDSLRQCIKESVLIKLRLLKCGKESVRSTLKGLITPFDMSEAPLMRAALLEISPQRHVLFIDIHHSVCDQRSLEIMLKDLSELYQGVKPAQSALTYKDYAVWQQDFMQSESMKMQREYWKGTLKGELPLLNMHTDRPRPAEQRFHGARISFRIPKETTASLRSFAQRHGGTLFMAVLAVYNVMLMKYTGQEDIIVGTPASGRTRDELRDITGVFVNTLPMRNYPRGDQSFADFFGSVVKSCAAALSNEDCPLERMIADIGLPRDLSRNPLFDTMLIVAKDQYKVSLGNTDIKMMLFDPGFAKLDLTLEVYEHGEGLQCFLEYSKRLFKGSTVRRMSEHFCMLAAMLPETPEIRLSDAQMMTQQEIWQVTQGFNQTDRPLPDHSIQSILEMQAEKRADKTALIVEGKAMSFAELNNRANQIAYKLREIGCGRNTIVALGLKRSFDLIASIFGVLKAGGGYLPLDISYPAERLSYMLSNCEAEIMLTDGGTDVPFEGKTVRMDEIKEYGALENPESIGHIDDIAYVMYTSGSTGLPKGTMLRRRGLLNLYEGVKGPISYDAAQTSISITTVSFDIFICDAIMPLLNGSTVVLCTEEELRQPHRIAELIDRYDVKFIEATPTRMSIMMEDTQFQNAMARHIEKIVLGGEIIPVSLLKLLKKCCSARIINGYAPTETTVYSSFKELTGAVSVTIGRPIQNTRFYILDQNRRPVPVGVLGEAYISGFGVAKGYIKREDLSNESFLPDPFWPGQTMYKTGDVCVFFEDGDMEMCGRIDHQIKLRGLRIELGEIESALREMRGVEDAVVKDWGEGAFKYLCAYYVAADGINAETLRAYLNKKLPKYMIPSFFVRMNKLPTTLNGKVNRKALTEPERVDKKVYGNRIEKMTDVENKMAGIWSRVLKADGIGPDSNFLELGGDSLGIIKAQAAALQYDWMLNTKDFYECKTLRELCMRINGQEVSSNNINNTQWDRHIPELSHIKPVKLKSVLLTGATGYLGAFLLAELLKAEGTDVYCLVRGKDYADARKRLQTALHFYFGAQFSNQHLFRVKVIQGDITEAHFGVNEKEYQNLLENVDTVIHSAALTDHIGRAEVFEKVNVNGTHVVASFAMEANASMVHISTGSVSGTHYTDDTKRKGLFAEDDFYIGQNYEENEYVRSKFLSEDIVIQHMKRGLNARMFRIGLLTCAMDGRFQMRPERNAFAYQLKSLCSIGCAPLGAIDRKIEMTPVDICAQMIIRICQSGRSDRAVYHLFNKNIVMLSELIGMLEKNGYGIRIMSDREFMALIKKLSGSGDYSRLSGLMFEGGAYAKEPAIRITADITEDMIKCLSLEWPVIDSEYVGRFISSLGCIIAGEGKQWN